MDPLGYGTHMMVDGFGASAPLLDEPWMIDAAYTLLRTLGPGGADPVKVSYWFPDGVSVGLARPESHLTLHTFVGRQLVCVGIFTPQLVSVQGFSSVFGGRFQLGRLEGHLGSRNVVLPQDEGSALRYLWGERNYTDVRLDDRLLVA